jgi:biopolymer transport protein TolQ
LPERGALAIVGRGAGFEAEGARNGAQPSLDRSVVALGAFAARPATAEPLRRARAIRHERGEWADMEPGLVTDGAVMNAALGSTADFSLWALFLRADLVVKSVMIGLILASFWSWAVIIDKWLKMGRLSRGADKFEDVFWSGKSLDELYQAMSKRPDHPMSVMFVSAMREWRRSAEGSEGKSMLGGLSGRIEKVLNVTLMREMSGVEKNLGFLATVGTSSPFIGLFGTVWGIMNAFQDIAISRDTNLAVVAPGIAEALFATALGLFAAIPAYMAYNKFSNDISRFATRLEGFAEEFSAIVSRQLDQRAG